MKPDGFDSWLPKSSEGGEFFGPSREYTREEFAVRIHGLGERPPWWRFIARRSHDAAVRSELWWFLSSFSAIIHVDPNLNVADTLRAAVAP